MRLVRNISVGSPDTQIVNIGPFHSVLSVPRYLLTGLFSSDSNSCTIRASVVKEVARNSADVIAGTDILDGSITKPLSEITALGSVGGSEQMPIDPPSLKGLYIAIEVNPGGSASVDGWVGVR